ncbi:unnamed protein product [Scytosiphon promiscuus]
MIETRAGQASPRLGSMTQSTRVLMAGLAFSVVARVGALVNPKGTIPFTLSNGRRKTDHFEASGVTEIMPSFVRMTPDEPSKVGALWSKYVLRHDEFSLEWKFRVCGGENRVFGASTMLVISPTKQEDGIDENFMGLAIIVGTNQQSSTDKTHARTNRYQDVSILANNGTKLSNDVLAHLDGCMAGLAPGHHPLRSSRLRLKVHNNKVSIDVDARNTGGWQRCVAELPIDLPGPWPYASHVGLISQTFGTSRSQDLIRLQMYTDPNEAWTTDLYGEDQEEMDVLRQHTVIGDSSVREPAIHVGHQAGPVLGGKAISIREERILGKKALKEACSDSAEFARCQHDKGSVLQLEKCIRNRGRGVSGRCKEGIEAWKSLLMETAPGARNMPPVLGKDSPGEGGSSHAHAVKNQATKNKQALAKKHAIGRGISKNNMDNTRTSQVHKTPNPSMKRKDGTKRPSPRGQMQGDHDVGRGRAPHLDHEQKKHAPHSGGPPRSHHHGGAGGGKRVGSGKFHAAHSDVDAINHYPPAFDSSGGEDGVSLVTAQDAPSLLVGYLSLALIVAFLITRAVRTLAQHTNRHRGASGDDVPGGYQALPEDDAAAAATAGSVSSQQREGATSGGVDGDYVDDDDAIVVTGTPVNPPSSVVLE